MMEQVLEDMAAATDLRAIILRYFNPIGSDPDLESGIYVRSPRHVLGQLVMAARGQKDRFTITGTEHPPATAPASATTSTCGTSRAPTCGPSSVSTRCWPRSTRRARSSTSAPATGVTVRELVASFERVFGPRCRSARRPPRPGDAVGVVRQRRPVRGAARLAHRADHRRRDRLRPGLGREAPGDPGVRVRRSSGSFSRSRWCWRGQVRERRPRTVRRPRRLPRVGRHGRGPLAGRVIVIDPGHQLGNSRFPGRINRWCRRAGSRSPATPPVRRPTAATPRRHSPGGWPGCCGSAGEPRRPSDPDPLLQQP